MARLLRWEIAAAHAAAYRKQFCLDMDRSLLGERPEHGGAARAWDTANPAPRPSTPQEGRRRPRTQHRPGRARGRAR